MAHRLFLISYLPSMDDSNALRERVKSMGFPCYNFHPGNWLVASEVDQKQIYEQLSQGEPLNMLVIETKLNYWGRMNTSLWEWLSSMKTQFSL